MADKKREPIDSGTVDDESEGLARKLKAIREPTMRRHALVAFLTETPAPDVVAILSIALARSRDGDTRGLVVIDTLTTTLTNTSLLSYDDRASLYACAKSLGQQTVARLLFGASPSGISEAEAKAALAPERPVIPRGKPLTLGERKRGHRREMLAHLLRDPHPDVVAILLNNPHITERDVLVIATRRTPQPAALVAVARNHRWRVRYNVRRALVLNPFTPALESLRLATTLRPKDLQLIAADTKLSPTLRQQAKELLSAR